MGTCDLEARSKEKSVSGGEILVRNRIFTLVNKEKKSAGTEDSVARKKKRVTTLTRRGE